MVHTTGDAYDISRTQTALRSVIELPCRRQKCRYALRRIVLRPYVFYDARYAGGSFFRRWPGRARPVIICSRLRLNNHLDGW